MQKKVLMSLILLLGPILTTQTGICIADNMNELTTNQTSSAVLTAEPDTFLHGNQLMQDPFQKNQWQLVSYFTPQGMQTAELDHLATILFSEQKISGSTGCNQYFATYQLFEHQGIQFFQTGTTMMACQGNIAKQEQNYLQNLADIRFYQIQGEQLNLIDTAEQLRLIFKALPALKLEEGVWEVTGINNGHGGVVSNTYTNQAYLQFNEGALQGGSGCNSLTASYQTVESQLIIGPLSSTRKLCAQEKLMTQEQQMLQALSQVTHYEIRTKQLRLLNINGSLLMSLKPKG